jgi:head-tail adaptor
MRSLNIGELVHDVTIQQGTDGVDGSGAPIQVWTDLRTVSMSRREETTGESFRGEQLSAAIMTNWSMRYSDDMDRDTIDVPKTRRLVYLGRIYDIVSAEVMDRRAGIILRTIASSRLAA